jgi:mannose-6-phosphate isomerase-like protein (cupin superfamily)
VLAGRLGAEAIRNGYRWLGDLDWSAKLQASKPTAMPDPLPTRIKPTALQRAITQAYQNDCLTRVNDHEVRMSVMTHPFGWHHHPDSDETFLVIEGELVISFEEGEVVLAPGEMLTVEAGRVHKTRPGGARSVNLRFERAGAETVFLEG